MTVAQRSTSLLSLNVPFTSQGKEHLLSLEDDSLHLTKSRFVESQQGVMGRSS